MKKLLMFTPLLFAYASPSFAQPQKGSWLIGASIANGTGYISPHTNNFFNININPRAGYFLSNRLAAGADIGFGMGAATGFRQTVFNYNISPFIRYYFAKKEGMIANKAYLFTEASIGYAGLSYYDGFAYQRRQENMMRAGAGLGLAYFITPNVSIEGLFKLNANTGPRTPTINVAPVQPSLGFGFQIYLGGRNKSAKTE